MSVGWILVTFGIAAAVSALSTPMVSRLARRLQVVDRPSDRKVNRRSDIPLLGGLAVGLGFFVGLAIVILVVGEDVAYKRHVEGALLGGLLLICVGAFDDRWTLGARSKLGVQIAAAAIAIYYGFQIDHVTEPFSRTTWWFEPPVIWLATTLWIVGVTNAMNLIDGLDGLATGLGVIIAITLTFTCWQAGEALGVFMGAALTGSLLGFLPFNFWPARIFLGDTGALFIGFSLSLLALEGYKQANVLTFVVPLLALAVPIIDTSLSVLRRIRTRTHIFTPDRHHMHHRLMEVEGSHRSAVLSLYFLTACFCILAVSFTRLGGTSAILFLLMVVVLTIRMIKNLGALENPTVTVRPGEPAAREGRGE